MSFSGLGGVGGTIDFYQPTHGELLVDGDFSNCQRDSRYGLKVHSLSSDSARCDLNELGPVIEDGYLGSFVTNRKGRGNIHTFADGLDLDDLIGKSLAIEGRFEDFWARDQMAQTSA